MQINELYVTAKNMAKGLEQYNGQAGKVIRVCGIDKQRITAEVEFGDGRHLYLDNNENIENKIPEDRFDNGINRKFGGGGGTPKPGEIARRVRSNRAYAKILRRGGSLRLG